MSPMSKVLQGANERAELIKAIAENNYHASAFELTGQLLPERLAG